MAKLENSIIDKGFLFKNDKYKLLSQIGEGGFGVVYLVKDSHDKNEERLF